MSDSVQPHRRQPIRLPCPWDSPGKNTGVGCHVLLQCMKVKSESEVTQSCLAVTPWTAAHQPPPPMGLSRQEYWSGLPLSSPKGNLIPINSHFPSSPPPASGRHQPASDSGDLPLLDILHKWHHSIRASSFQHNIFMVFISSPLLKII